MPIHTHLPRLTTPGTTPNQPSLALDNREKAGALAGKTAIYDNARCYSALAYWHGVLAAPTNISGKTIAVWLKSPLARELVAGESEQVGDVIAMSETPVAGVPLDHVAVLHAKNAAGEAIWFSKPGSISENPFELVTTKELIEVYPSAATGKRYRIVESFEAHLDRLCASPETADVGQTARGFHQELTALEQRLFAFTLQTEAELEQKPDSWFEAFDAELTTAKAATERMAEKLQAKISAATTSHTWLWKLFLERTTGVDSTTGPFD